MKLKRILALALAMLLLAATVPALDIAASAEYNMPYYIEVDLTNQIVTIKSTISDVIVRQMLCSTGVKDATPTGTYYLPKKEEKLEREEWYYFRSYSCYAHYATRIYKGVLFHSIPCAKKSDSSISKTALADFGHPASHGCVRLLWPDAEFIAKCCLEGTRVRIYKSRKKNNELREMLYAASYTNEKGQSYKAYLGISEEEGVLGRYSEGKEVVSLQTRLRDLGIFNDKIDGEYGSTTVNAVREAQRLIGQEDSGIATLDFQDIIFDDADAPTAQNVPVKEGMSGPVVRNMQQYLKTLKLYDGAIDGVFDVDVCDAVKKFQGAYDYPTDGVLTPEIQKALYYEAGKVKAMFPDEDGYDCEVTGGQIYMGVVSSNVGIRLREKASAGSSALGRLASGDMVVALEHGDGWSKVQRQRDIGYVKNEYLTYYPQQIYQLKYTARDSSVSYTIGYLEKDYYAGVSIPAEVFEDYLASGRSLDDHEGISTFARVNTEGPDVSLNLREGPNTVSAILDELPYDTEVRVLLRSSEWSLVEWQDKTGYLLNQYLEFWEAPEDSEGGAAEDVDAEDADNNELPAMVQAMEGRSAPVYDVDSDDAEVLGHLDNGTRVMVVETVDGWSLINYQGHSGYMKDADLQFMLADEVVT